MFNEESIVRFAVSVTMDGWMAQGAMRTAYPHSSANMDVDVVL